MRIDDRQCGLAEAIASVPNGSSIALGGFLHFRHPMAAVRELIRQGKRDLRAITPIGGIDADMLVAAEALASIAYGFVSLEAAGMAPAFARSPNPELEYVDYGDQTLVRSLQATTLRVPWIPIRTWIGSEIGDHHPGWEVELDGEPYWAAPAIAVDVAVLHVPYATARGDYLLWGEGFDSLIAKAADRLIITAEEVVSFDQLQAVAADRPNAVGSGHYGASHVVAAPMGAYPTSCFPMYTDDLLHQLEYHDLVRAGRWSEYAASWIDEDEDHFRQQVALPRRAALAERMRIAVELGRVLRSKSLEDHR